MEVKREVLGAGGAGLGKVDPQLLRVRDLNSRQLLRGGVPAGRRGLVCLGTGTIIRWSGGRRRSLCAGVLARRAALIVVGTGIFIRWGGHRRRLARGGALAGRAGVIFFGRGPFAGGA